MKRWAAATIVVALVSLPRLAAAFSVDSPHSPAEGFSCVNCHTTHSTLGSSGYNNICLTCHRPGVPLAGMLPLVPADAANPYDTGPSPLSRYQISHRWEGSDTAPQAGAQPPVFPTMTGVRGKTGGLLACVRCHNPHDNTNGHFLRMPNDQDQLCLDCHRSRNTRDHTRGTHPVNFGWLAPDSKVVLQPSGYRNPPLNANSANPTSDLGRFFKGGKVVCTTCHRVHNADSNSATYDSYSTYYTLTASQGNLLRTDPRGKGVAAGGTDAPNICTNCHAGKKNHNGKGQDVQCLDCHGAHVEVADGSTPNTFLVRRFMNFSGNAGWVRNKVVFTSATSALSANFKDPNGTGVCQSCHEVPLGVSPKHSLAQAQARDCQDCHFHNSPLGSFSGGCGACHGYPITATTIGGPDGLATPPTGVLGAAPADPGAHGRHVTGRAIQCVACHYGYTASPMGNHVLEMGFGVSPQTWTGFAGTVASGTINVNSSLNSGYSWNAAVGTILNQAPGQQVSCNVYCHGSTLSGGSVPQPVWTGGSSQAACGSCHGASTATPPLTGSHPRHAGGASGGLALPCSSCHGDIGSRPHVNGTVFWDLTPLGTTAQYRGAAAGATGELAPSASYGQCSNLYCHSPGTSFTEPYAPPATLPTWGGTLPAGCGGCHGGPPNGPSYPSSPPKTNSHPAHAGLGCNKCHGTVTADGVTITNPALHANKSYDVAAGGGASFGVVVASGGTATSCSDISCHGGAGHNAAWGTTLGCQDCHTAAADNDVFSVPFSTASPVATVGLSEWGNTGHGRTSGSYRSGNTAAGFSGAGECLYCHDSGVAHNSAANAFRLLTYSSATWGRNQVCQSCHAPGGAGVTVKGVVVNAATKVGSSHLGAKHGLANNGGQYCWDCHDPHGDANDYMIQAQVAKSSDSSGAPLTTVTVRFLMAQAGAPAWGDFVKGAPGYGGLCQACHSTGGSSVVGHFTAASFDAGHNPGGACTDCHSHSGTTGTLGFQPPAGGCGACHGYPPVPAGFIGRSGNWSSARSENYPGGGGAHAIAKHVAPSARPAAGFANCDKCHTPTDHQMSPVQFLPSANIKVRLNTRSSFVQGVQGRYSSNRLDGSAHSTGICSNVNCHFGGSPKWDPQH